MLQELVQGHGEVRKGDNLLRDSQVPSAAASWNPVRSASRMSLFGSSLTPKFGLEHLGFNFDGVGVGEGEQGGYHDRRRFCTEMNVKFMEITQNKDDDVVTDVCVQVLQLMEKLKRSQMDSRRQLGESGEQEPVEIVFGGTATGKGDGGFEIKPCSALQISERLLNVTGAAPAISIHRNNRATTKSMSNNRVHPSHRNGIERQPSQGLETSLNMVSICLVCWTVSLAACLWHSSTVVCPNVLPSLTPLTVLFFICSIPRSFLQMLLSLSQYITFNNAPTHH